MSGDVEMFWVEQGQLLMAAVPVADGIDDGQFVNGHYDHDPYWATVQRTHMHLWDVEYFHVPRGGCSSTRLKTASMFISIRSCAPTPSNG